MPDRKRMRPLCGLLLLACAPLAAAPPVFFPADPHLPRVLLGEDGRHLSAAGDRIYADGLGGRSASHYHVIRPGPVLDRDSDRRPGRSSIYLGQARVAKGGEPAMLIIERSRREIRPGDYLLAIDRGVRERDD